MTGPLHGVRVIELVGQGPGPYGAMILADLGADVIAVERPEVAARVHRTRLATNPMMRGKRSIALDLKNAVDIATLLELTDHLAWHCGLVWPRHKNRHTSKKY